MMAILTVSAQATGADAMAPKKALVANGELVYSGRGRRAVHRSENVR